MEQRVYIPSCLVCGNNHFEKKLTCKDHTVSGELFDLCVCTNCGFVITNPRPINEILGNYYKSDDYISHSDTNKGIISKVYHLVRKYALYKKERLISNFVSRGTLLDYGCGTGAFASYCNQRGWRVYGMEPDSEARNASATRGVDVSKSKEELSPNINDGSLSAITLWHVLEHITDLKQTLAFFQEKLSDSGKLFIAVPNHNSYDAQHYREYWAAYDVPRHLYHFDIKSVSKLLNAHGFLLVDTKPMKFDSFYVSMLSEKYKHGKIKFFSALIVGLVSNLKAKAPCNYSSVIYIFSKKS